MTAAPDHLAEIRRLVLAARDAEPVECLRLHREIHALHTAMQGVNGELRPDSLYEAAKRSREPLRELRVGRYGPPKKRRF